MLRRAPFVASCLTLVACSGGDAGTNPPPRPVNRVASVAAVDTSILQFTGKKVALSTLFVAKDSGEVVIPGASLTCTTPAGFMLTGDSLVAPSAEARGKLRCSATTIHPSAMVLAPALASGSDPADSLTVTAGIDLRAYTWRAAWKCTGGGPSVTWHMNGVPIGRVDSLALDGHATFTYPDAANFVANWGGIAQVWWHGNVRMWYNDVEVFNDTTTQETAEVVRSQDVNALNFDSGTLTLVNAVPRRYVGGNWCRAITVGTGTAIGPVTLEEVVP